MLESATFWYAITALAATVVPLRYTNWVLVSSGLAIPFDYFADWERLAHLPPALVAALIMLFRTVGRPAAVLSAPRLVIAAYGALAFFVVVESRLSTLGTLRTLSLLVWPIVIAMAVSRTERFQAVSTARVIAWCAGAVALYSFVEASLGRNPWFDDLYASASQFPLVQKWSEYRVTTIFGHPLTNSMVFAFASALMLGDWWSGRRRTVLFLAGLSGVAAALTVSRSGLVAIAAAAAFIPISIIFQKVQTTRGIAGPLFVAAVAAVPIGSLGLTQLGQRDASVEGLQSSQYRSDVWRAGWEGIQNQGFFGTGAGSLAERSSRLGLQTIGNFENSFIEYGLAFGLPLVISLVGLIAVSAARAVRAGNVAAGCGLVAMSVCAFSFNAFTGHSAALAVLAFALGIAWATPIRGAADADHMATEESDLRMSSV